MNRRQFLQQSAAAATLAGFPYHLYAGAKKKSASDIVELGPAKVKLSRVAMGTVIRGGRGGSNQTRQLGVDGLADLYW